MADQVVQPGEQQVRLVAHGTLHPIAGCLERFKLAPKLAGLRSA